MVPRSSWAAGTSATWGVGNRGGGGGQWSKFEVVQVGLGCMWSVLWLTQTILMLVGWWRIRGMACGSKEPRCSIAYHNRQEGAEVTKSP